MFTIDSVDTSEMLEVANRWHPNIQFENTGLESLSFLDLQLSRDLDDTLKWELYVKPQNLYLYVPRHSNHPAGVFKSIIVGGMKRIDARNKFKADAERHKSFFRSKLNERGYSNAFIRTVLKGSTAGRPPSKAFKKLFLTVPFNDDILVRKLSQTLKAAPGLRHRALANSKVTVAWTVGRNMFRMNYRRTWTRQRAEGGA